LDNALEKAKYGSDFVFDCVSQRDFSKLEDGDAQAVWDLVIGRL
jgi:hypothetical protein